MKPVRTGIFSGSFNPIHIGHLALANYLCEFGGVDEVWFLVSPQNPFKKQDDLWDDELRMELVRISVRRYRKFAASDFEFGLPKPSYTIRTLDALRATFPDRDFYLIIGADNWLVFDKWYEADRLLREYHLVIYPRPGYPVDLASLPPTVRFVDAPVLEISSTFIRDAMAEGHEVGCFMDPDAYAYLKEHGAIWQTSVCAE